jgi:AcrR family transcriptional regulator
MPVTSTTSGSRSFRGQSADTRQRERRERLIAAGTQAFGTLGFHAVTVRQICAEARLTERYFYESFRNLEELFAAVYTGIAAQLKQLIWEAAARAEQEPLAISDAALRAFFGYIREDARRAQILFIDVVNIDRRVLRIAGTIADDNAAFVSVYIKQLFPKLELRTGNIDLLAQALVGANIQVATHWVRDKFRTPLDEVVASVLVLYRGLISLFESNRQAEPRPSAAPRASARSGVRLAKSKTARKPGRAAK